ncbi:MAG: LysR family transcriptional regulator, partial [Oscillibacter sp.]|nr:LysR family transcriptional regulator [Oscillibacter sp.]
MTDRELLYVTTIAQEGSLTKAAQKLFITQPALSHSLTGIERALGQPLFRRESRGLIPTYAGERYCETAREILRMYGDLEQELAEIQGLRRGRVLIGMTRFLSTELMPRVFPQYQRQYPGIEVQLWEESSNRLLEMLSTRQLDFGVMNLTEEELGQMEESYDCRPLYRDPFVIAAAKGDPIGRLASPGEDGGLPVLDPRYLAG